MLPGGNLSAPITSRPHCIPRARPVWRYFICDLYLQQHQAPGGTGCLEHQASVSSVQGVYINFPDIGFGYSITTQSKCTLKINLPQKQSLSTGEQCKLSSALSEIKLLALCNRSLDLSFGIMSSLDYDGASRPGTRHQAIGLGWAGRVTI